MIHPGLAKKHSLVPRDWKGLQWYRRGAKSHGSLIHVQVHAVALWVSQAHSSYGRRTAPLGWKTKLFSHVRMLKRNIREDWVSVQIFATGLHVTTITLVSEASV